VRNRFYSVATMRYLGSHLLVPSSFLHRTNILKKIVDTRIRFLPRRPTPRKAKWKCSSFAMSPIKWPPSPIWRADIEFVKASTLFISSFCDPTAIQNSILWMEKKGFVGDFDAGTGRRKVIFVAEEGREVWVKPENLKLCVSSPVPIKTSKIPILTDVQDRMKLSCEIT